MPPYNYGQSASKDELTDAISAMLAQYMEPVSNAVIEHGGSFELQFEIDEVVQTPNSFSLTGLRLSINVKW